MKKLKNLYPQTLASQEELLDVEINYLNKIIDAEKREKWAALLEKEGIGRQEIRNQKAFSFNALLRVAAIALLLVGAWWAYTHTIERPKKLVAVYLESPFVFNDGKTRSEGMVEVIRAKAYKDYEYGEYEKVAAQLSPIVANGQGDAMDQFLLGLCYLQGKDKKPELAVKHLLEAQKIGGAYKDETSLYLGMAYILLGEKEKANIMLQSVMDSPSSREQARETARSLLR
jgi:hypothetical protein